MQILGSPASAKAAAEQGRLGAAADRDIAPSRNPVVPGDVEVLGSDVEAEPMDLRSEDDKTPAKRKPKAATEAAEAAAEDLAPDITAAAAAGEMGVDKGDGDAGRVVDAGGGGDAAVVESEQVMHRFQVGRRECELCLAGLEAAVDRHAEVKEALESERQALNNLLVGDKMQQQLELGEPYYLVPK